MIGYCQNIDKALILQTLTHMLNFTTVSSPIYLIVFYRHVGWDFQMSLKTVQAPAWMRNNQFQFTPGGVSVQVYVDTLILECMLFQCKFVWISPKGIRCPNSIESFHSLLASLKILTVKIKQVIHRVLDSVNHWVGYGIWVLFPVLPGLLFDLRKLFNFSWLLFHIHAVWIFLK